MPGTSCQCKRQNSQSANQPNSASMDVQLGPISASRADSTPVTADARYPTQNEQLYQRHQHQTTQHLHQQQFQQQQFRQTQQPPFQQIGYEGPTLFNLTPNMRKRKAEPQLNERLSKRLSRLHLDNNGRRLCVPVESPTLQAVPEPAGYQYSPEDRIPTAEVAAATATATASSAYSPSPVRVPTHDDDSMRLDDTKHKVYIYDLEAELASADEDSDGESWPTSGHDRVIFSPDMEKHFGKPRIPPAVLANSAGQLAGHSMDDMQMVLYSEPSSISVPREHDSVRKAILEARARARQKQNETQTVTSHVNAPISPDTALRDFDRSNGNNTVETRFVKATNTWSDTPVAYDDDVDAMDTD